MELPFIAHSPESEEAAASSRVMAETKRQMVLDFLLKRGDLGATDDEMQVALGINPSTQRPRRVELYESKRIVKTLQTRMTRGRRKAVVWVAYQVATGRWPRADYKIYPEQ